VTGAVFTISVKCDKVKGKTDLFKKCPGEHDRQGGILIPHTCEPPLFALLQNTGDEYLSQQRRAV
jgi:hypothetical protein